MADLRLGIVGALHNDWYPLPCIRMLLELGKDLLCDLLLVAQQATENKDESRLETINAKTRTSFPPLPV